MKGRIPASWQVLVLADRGLYARWLYTAIVDCGWHPFLRINQAVKAREPGEASFDWLSRWVSKPGARWKGPVECFAQKRSRLCCTLLAQWEPGYEHPWVVITDLSAAEAQIAWYSLRAWVEAGFKDLKRGGWGWQHSKMRDASRVERFWLAMATALVWTVSVGSQADSQLAGGDLERLPAGHIARKRVKRQPGQLPARRLSCPQRGRLVLLAALVRAEDLSLGAIVAEPWPKWLMPCKRSTNPTKMQQKAKQQERKRRYKAGRRRKQAA